MQSYEKMGTQAGQRLKALRDREISRHGSPRSEDERGQDDRLGYRVIIEARTEPVDPLAQTSPFRVHNQVRLLDPARGGGLAGDEDSGPSYGL